MLEWTKQLVVLHAMYQISIKQLKNFFLKLKTSDVSKMPKGVACTKLKACGFQN